MKKFRFSFLPHKTTFGVFILLGVVLCSFLWCEPSFANALRISRVSLKNVREDTNEFWVCFDLQWQNSWRTDFNHDAAWVVVKLAVNGGEILHGTLLSSGIDPKGTSTGGDKNFEIYVPEDKAGAFIRRKVNGDGAVNLTRVTLKLDGTLFGLKKDDSVDIFIAGTEMVFIPAGAFYAGDGAAYAGFASELGSETPWLINTESAIDTGDGQHAYTAVGDGNPEFASGERFMIPAGYPKGHQAVYCMKYEITEGQWVNFFNTLTIEQKLARDVTDENGKNTGSVKKRNTVSWIGGKARAVTTRPERAMNWLNWMDLCAYLDWVGLRPMTELEFEKISRGAVGPLQHEYAWGSVNILAAEELSAGQESGGTVVLTPQANAHFGGATLRGGDSATGAEHAQGPVRIGIFSVGASGRESAGAGLYGVMELSGNVMEQVVSIGNSEGLKYTGEHGNGTLTMRSGYEGNADVEGWPGTDAEVATRGVTDAAGCGARGGAWDSPAAHLEISDRSFAVKPSLRTAASGGRGVRTYDYVGP